MLELRSLVSPGKYKMTLQITPLCTIPLINSGDNLSQILIDAIATEEMPLQDGDILVLAQKIISKSENRFVNLSQIVPSERALEYARLSEKDPRFIELVLQESSSVLRTRPGTIIVEHKLGFVCANAGIDHSNVEGNWGNDDDWVLLLPENPDKSASKIRKKLESYFSAHVGVMIIDSHGRAWRTGTVGVCIGLSGLPGLVDLRGQEDLFGFKLKITQVGAADELAAAASLVMGQAAERIPAVIVRGFPYVLREGNLKELIRPKELDLFR